MNTFGIIMGQIELFVVLILVGILAVKTKILNQEALGYFSKYLMRIAIPVMIFTNTIHGATRAELLSSIPVLLVAAVMFVGLSLLAWVMSGLLKLQGNERQIYRAASTFGNIGFMGLPLVAALFPETGMLYIHNRGSEHAVDAWHVAYAASRSEEGEVVRTGASEEDDQSGDGGNSALHSFRASGHLSARGCG